MKIVTNLQGSVPDPAPEWKENRGIVGTAMNCPAKGFYRHMQLQGAGLVMSRGKNSVCIPAAELWKLAEQIEPELKPPPQPVQPAAIPTKPAQAAPKK